MKRFKGIQEVSLPLGRINILVGSNNCGKSSLLQAAQFAVSVAQTLRVLNASWSNDQISASFATTQLIYSPSREIRALALNGHFAESTNSSIQIELDHTGVVINPKTGEPPVIGPDLKTCVTIKKGRGQNIRCIISGAELGRQLEPIVQPFSVFVPGLAGIPNVEEAKSAATVRRSAARGDANNVLRNVLLLLKRDKVQWQQFQTDFQRVFPGRTVAVDFNPDLDEYIHATIETSGRTLPIDAAGTGVLQTIQILAYINLSKPKLLILDEPDAHLHPNNQRRLAELLLGISESRSFQVLISTHSRHLVDAFRSNASMHWIRAGARVQNSDYDELSVLLEVGALDRGDLLKNGKIKCIILTEDDDTSVIEALAISSGCKKDETEFWSYKGCSKLETAIALIAFIANHAPATKALVHRDRDYMLPNEATDFETSLKKAHPQAAVFLTPGTDAESCFLSPEHLNHINPSLTAEKAAQIIDQATNDTKEESIRIFINSRTHIETARLRKENKQVNHGELAFECRKLYEAEPKRFRHGKKVMGQVRALTQAEVKTNPNPYIPSPFVANQSLTADMAKIWPAAPAAAAPTAPSK